MAIESAARGSMDWQLFQLNVDVLRVGTRGGKRGGRYGTTEELNERRSEQFFWCCDMRGMERREQNRSTRVCGPREHERTLSNRSRDTVDVMRLIW